MKIRHIILFIVSLWEYYNAPQQLSFPFMLQAIVIMLLSVFSFGFTGEKIKGLRKYQWLKHSSLFLLGFLVVHYQYYIDFILGNVDESLMDIWVDYHAVGKSIALSNIALNAFFLGYSNLKHIKIKDVPDVKYNRIDTSLLSLLLIVSLCCFYLFIDKTYLFGGYGQFAEMGVIATEASKLFRALLVVIIVIHIKNLKFESGASIALREYWKVMKVPIICGFLFCVADLMSGSRRGFIAILLLFILSVLSMTKVVISKKNTILFGAIFIFSMALIGGIRNYSSSMSMSEKISSAYDERMNENSSISPFTQELAGSVRTLHFALSNVPSYFPYNFGLTFFNMFLTLIPGGRGVFLSFFSIPEMFQSSALFFTILMLGPDYTYGVGTTCVADIYISFGILGIVILFVFLGMFFRYLEIKTFVTRNVSTFILLLSFYFYSNIVFMSRESLLSSLFGITYSFLFYFLAKKIVLKCN